MSQQKNSAISLDGVDNPDAKGFSLSYAQQHIRDLRANQASAHKKIRDYFVFVPYWNVTAAPLPPEQFPINPATTIYSAYFGVTADTQGLATAESGYSRLEAFSTNFNTYAQAHPQYKMKKLLTVRMLDETVNSHYLGSQEATKALADSITNVVRQHEFAGIILDFEHSVLPSPETSQAITHLYQTFSTTLRAQNLVFVATLYGDTFYRQRPYDVVAIGKEVDYLLIMAYDFHKAAGEPGPNFPFVSGGDDMQKYPYSFAQMIEAFPIDVPAEKLAVIFGMYGYDWTVDEEGRPLKSAQARTLLQTDNICRRHNCVLDEVSQEMTSRYREDNSESVTTSHVLWFENGVSSHLKALHSLEQNVASFGFWAAGYY